MKKILIAIVSLIFHAQFSFAGSIEVSADQKYIYYRTNWAHLSAEAQKEVIDASVDILKDELSIVAPKLSEKAAKSFKDNFVDSGKLTDILRDAQKSVDVKSDEGLRQILPSGFVLYAGGGGGIALGAKGALSGLFGLVFVPTQVTRVNIIKKTSVTYFEFSWSPVLIGGGQVGVGLGGGSTFIFGAHFIFGDLSKASDFTGFLARGSLQFQPVVGSSLGLSVLYNQFTKKIFYLGGLDLFIGPNVDVSANGAGAYVLPIRTALGFLTGDKEETDNVTKILVKSQPLQMPANFEAASSN